MGFVNPIVYQLGAGADYGADFHDIADNSTNLFYHATPGYDNATGWGSINGTGLFPDLVNGGVGPSAPTANSQTVAVAINQATPIVLTGSDSNTPPLAITFILGAPPTHGTLSGFNAVTGAVTYTPNTGYHSADSFTFTVKNSAGQTSTPATVTLNVGVGMPTALPQTVSVPYTKFVNLTLTATDPDIPALPLTFALGTLPTHGTLSGFNAATGAVTYTPNPTFLGTDTFTFTASNGTNTSAPATITLKIAAGTPSAIGQTINTNLNTLVPITLAGSDPDVPALPLTYAIKAFPTHGTLSFFNAATGTVRYQPTAGYLGADSFTFTVYNGVNTSTVATVNITVIHDVSSQIEITRGNFLGNLTNGTYSQVLTLKNTGTTTISGPISVIVGNLVNGTLLNPTGITSAILPAGRPYVNLGVSSLAPGARTTLTLTFTKTGSSAINYTTQVVVGAGAR